MTACNDQPHRHRSQRPAAVRVVTVHPDGHACAEDLVLTVADAVARFGAPTAALLFDPARPTPDLTPADARRRYGHQAATLIFPADTDQVPPAGDTVEDLASGPAPQVTP